MAESISTDWRPTLRRRILVAVAGFVVWTAALEARLIYLQVVRHAELLARAERQQHRTIAVPAKRGEIVDRHGRVLAYSVDVDSIYAVPTEIGAPEAAAATLCAALDCSPTERDLLGDRLRRQRAFVYVRRQVSREEARRVGDLNLDGIGFLRESRRFYPNKELAAHLLGYVGIDNAGLAGVEAAYDKQVRGRPGAILVHTDARRHAFNRLERQPTAGEQLELTVDAYLQHVVERELHAGVVANRAAGGTAIIMDPRTGEILALANEPTFNPNAFRRVDERHRRNRAVQDLYEPGSTFKVVTASAALEEHVAGVNDPVDVRGGVIRLGSRVVSDVHAYGVLSFTDVIVKSSNVGAIKIGLRLGADRLGRYVRRFGFGRALSPDFPGENPGIVWDPARWSESALASISMGYQIGVTPLQMAAAVSSIANGGELVEPRIVRAMVTDKGRAAVQPRVVHRTVSPSTAAVLTAIMEQVVARGTATAAQIPGYTIAGKTGTSAKLVHGGYSKSDYNASIVGFVPSRNSAATIVVVIDSPHAGAYYGGAVAAPVFKRIAEATLRYRGIAPDINPEPPVLVARPRPDLPIETAAAARPPAVLTVSMGRSGEEFVPDVRGLGAREAVRALGRVGLTARLSGHGMVVAQEPPAGSPFDRDVVCQLRLDRQPVKSAPPSGQ